MAGFYTCFITRQDRNSRSCIVLLSQARRLGLWCRPWLTQFHLSGGGSAWLPLACSSESVTMLILPFLWRTWGPYCYCCTPIGAFLLSFAVLSLLYYIWMLHNNTPTPALSVFHPQPQLHLSAYLLAVFFFCKRKHDSLTRLVKCYGQKCSCSKSS